MPNTKFFGSSAYKSLNVFIPCHLHNRNSTCSMCYDITLDYDVTFNIYCTVLHYAYDVYCFLRTFKRENTAYGLQSPLMSKGVQNKTKNISIFANPVFEQFIQFDLKINITTPLLDINNRTMCSCLMPAFL